MQVVTRLTTAITVQPTTDEGLNNVKHQTRVLFIINCKNYENISGDKIIKFLKTAQAVSKKYNVNITVSPPQHLLALAASSNTVPILAQHVDDSKTGSTTGFVIPELLKKSGVAGSLINHSEHQISNNEITSLIPRLQKLDMVSVLCVKNVAKVKKYAKLNPNYIAIEPPELIGTGRAISTERPELIAKAADEVKKAKNDTKLLCGAGIVSGTDVAKAVKLGSKGILVASGVVKADNWNTIMSNLAKSMV